MGEFRMPSLGADMAQGTLLEWLVAPGDRVHRGDVVAVVDTDKAAMDIESFEEGVVDRLLADPGTVVPVGGLLAMFSPQAPDGADGAQPVPSTGPSPVPSTGPSPVPSDVPTHGGELSPPLRRLAHRLGVDPSTLRGSGRGGKVTRADIESAARSGSTGAEAVPAPPVPAPPTRGVRVKVSPMARRLAAELSVDPTTVAGTGRDGAVTALDVRRAAGRAESPSDATAPAPAPAPAAPTEAEPDRNASMRRAIGALMARSKREVPHYYLSTGIDLARAMSFLATQNADRPVGRRLVPAALLLKAAAVAARKVPQVNGFWADDAFVPAEQVHLGVAVSLRRGGLIAPAIHDADRLTVDELMAALRDLVARARGGRLRGSEMTDGTLTVTNLGDRGAEAVFGVIYPPQVALVGFGRVRQTPVAVDGMLAVHPVVTATLSADHRATDGHVGGLYLAAVADLLQEPEEL